MQRPTESSPLVADRMKGSCDQFAASASTMEQLKVYQSIHDVYQLVKTEIDIPLSDEQMKSPNINLQIIEPMIHYLAKSYNDATVYVLLLCRLQFLRERDSALASSSLNETRATLCEVLAIKMLRHAANIGAAKGPGQSLLCMSRALVGGLHAFQGAGEDVLERMKSKEGYASRYIAAGGGKTNTLELAILGKARHFIKSPTTQRVITAIWTGRIVYSSSSFINILPDTWKVQQIALYDIKKAPVLDHYRLRVPKYRAMIDTVTFIVLFISFLLVILDHNNRHESLPVHRLSLHEKWFFLYALGYSLDKLASVAEHGFSIYAAGLTNGLDLLSVPIFAIAFGFRIRSVFTNEAWAADQAYAVLSCAACLMFPRLAFGAISNNLLILSLRAMLADFFWLMGIAVFCFLGFVFALNHLCDGDYSIARIAEWLIFIWFGLDGSGLDASPSFHPVLGPILVVAYAALSNTLLVSLLVAILSSTYANIAADAAAEDMFRKAVMCFEGVKSDSVFDYVPPLNLIALLIMWPVSNFANPRWFHKLNVLLTRICSAPILLLIGLYERQSVAEAPLSELLNQIKVSLADKLPTKWTQKLSLLEGAHWETEAVFEYPPEENCSSDEEDSDFNDAQDEISVPAPDLQLQLPGAAADLENQRPRISSRASIVIQNKNAQSPLNSPSLLPNYAALHSPAGATGGLPASSPLVMLIPLDLGKSALSPSASTASSATPKPPVRFDTSQQQPRQSTLGSTGYGTLGISRKPVSDSPETQHANLSTSAPSPSAARSRQHQHQHSNTAAVNLLTASSSGYAPQPLLSSSTGPGIGARLRRQSLGASMVPPPRQLSLPSDMPSGSASHALTGHSTQLDSLLKLVESLSHQVQHLSEKLDENSKPETRKLRTREPSNASTLKG